MAAKGPLAPRISTPDLPRALEDVDTIGRSADVLGARIAGLAGDVDAAHARISESVLASAAVGRLDLTGATVSDVEVADVRATELVGRNSRWRTARFAGGRVGTFDLSGAQLEGVELRGMRIDYLSLRGATATDLLIADCTITTLDLPLATLSRVRFESVRADEVATDGLRADSLDLRGLDTLDFTRPDALRGATMSESQVMALAASLARAAGIDVRG